MLGQLLLPEIEELIETRQFATLREALAGLPEVADLGELFEELPVEHVAVLFRILPREQAADVFEHLPLELQMDLIRALGKEQVAAVLNEMDPDDRTALLEEMPAEAAKRLLEWLSPEERRVARDLLGYPEDSIGRLMTPEFVEIRRDWTVHQVLQRVREVGPDVETLNILYVTDETGHLLDDVLLREIVLADPDTPLSELLDSQYVALNANDDQEEAVPTFKKYDRSSLPVVDSAGKLVGIVTVDDVLDVAEEEETEDVQKMGAVEVLEAPYLDVSIFKMVRKRIGWLVILFLGATLTITALNFFEDQLKAFLVVFIPLLISSGGNTGSQAATLIIRALALGELTLADWWRVMWRELVSGLLLGLVLGVLALVRALVWPPDADAAGDDLFMVAIVVALSMLGIVMLGTLVGSMLPILLQRLGLDPAVSSTPFVATLVDVVGLAIYFCIAIILLRGTLL